MQEIFLKRVYDPFDEADGFRILIDRLWPRGISKADAKLDLWLKEVAPSTELRIEFNHKPDRFEEFRQNYIQELRTNDQQSKAVAQIITLASEQPLTLLYGAKDPVYNHAKVLLEEIKNRT